MTPPVCWILGGGGLLGGSLRHVVRSGGMEEFVPAEPFAWKDRERCEAQMADAVRGFAEASAGKPWRIVWAAGTGTMGSAEADLAEETTTLATLLGLLENEPRLARASGTFVYASSAGALYAGCRDDVITEASLPHPENAYGRAKLAEEDLLRAFAEHHPRRSLLLARITNLYGPAQAASPRRGLIAHVARSILRREPVNIFVPFDTIRDYVAADDAAAMIMRAADALRDGDVLVKIVASEEPTTIARIIGAFATITRMPPRVITSASALSASYPRRMCFRSVVGPARAAQTPLLVGIAGVLAAEKAALMRPRGSCPGTRAG